ncbi:acetyltransferase, ribosomal protein N-acetylase [Cryptosporangium arvum DSM 44712]|uniref:Acetyltransferase, ribosomal protein N-acetylase n=1 Tax=Cryptosporangium arvum DSM 44712 TaxID=927661 RepID=A0A010YWE6_9ACTN|nr:acetyltransferase, ribosomal protein N-acetylase [Cryptosporangium arvum DSM 44712]
MFRRCNDGAVNHRVRRLRPDDWREFRRLRLEALKDSPLAFVEQYDDALALPDDAWQERAAATDRATFVAVDADDRLVGMAGIFGEEAASAMLVGVYVTPAQRGGGAAAAVIGAAVEWARAELAVDQVRLFVLDVNERAKSFYRRLGFAETGGTMRYPPDPSYLELEMAVSALSAS